MKAARLAALAVVWGVGATGLVMAGGCATSERMSRERVAGAAGVREMVEAHVTCALTGTPVAAGRAMGADGAEPAEVDEAMYARVREVASHEAFARMMPVHRLALVRMLEMKERGEQPPMVCFAPGTDPAVVDAFNAATSGLSSRFQAGNRWTSTASGSVPNQPNTPVTLTYSFVPDGTIVPTLTSTSAASNLFARMAQIYGNDPSVWQAVYAQVLNRWSQLTGVRYVYEPHDDGVALGAAGSSGQVGVRGDIRFSGTALDGTNNVLAFNYFPGSGMGGDGVLDTSDAFFATTTSNSLRLRNVVAHEHGHGLGMNHVCPLTQTKLMEPYASLGYDGPQTDDILLGQRNYGDTYEPNNTSAAATVVSDLGTTAHAVTNLSVNGVADQDWFRFTLAAPSRVAITATPTGGSYLDGAQSQSTGGCSAGTIISPGTVNGLVATIVGADGTTVLDASVAADPGVAVNAEASVPAGTFYAKISGARHNDFILGYTLGYVASATPGLVVRLPSGPVSAVSPTSATPTSMAVRITGVADAVVGTPALMWRAGMGAFASVPLSVGSGTGMYTATFPAGTCGTQVQYYVEAAGSSGTVTYPAAAPSGVLTASVGDESVVFSDDFSTDKGWSYSATGDAATAGRWMGGTPIGSTSASGLPAQMGIAFGGAQCAFTGQGTSTGASATSADVDGGATTLTSPVIDLSGAADPVVSYMRWYFNDDGTSPETRTMRVLISGDGAAWIPVETIGPSGAEVSGGWKAHSFRVQQFLPALTSTVQVRFVVDDVAGTDSAVIEGGVDEFKVVSRPCVTVTPPPTCAAEFDGVPGLSTQDVFAYLNAWFAGETRADVDHSGGLTTQDVFQYLNMWFAGCP